MVTDDFPFAATLTDQMDWGLSEQDFEFATELEPQGCFILLDNSQKIGLVTTVNFGKIAWFGNLIVDKNQRNKGAGSTLASHAIKYLISKNVETVGLYAYVDRIPFYIRLGFKPDSQFQVLKGKAFPSNRKTPVKQAGKEDLNKIMEFDHKCFGASRKKMLEPIIADPDNICHVLYENNQVTGYAIAKVYRGKAELGPLVCTNKTLALDILKSVLNQLNGIEVSMFAPAEENEIISALKEAGFQESFRVQTMFFGPSAPKECVYMAESLERG
jgi:GNAT superfamily N-acetyltransferase